MLFLLRNENFALEHFTIEIMLVNLKVRILQGQPPLLRALFVRRGHGKTVPYLQIVKTFARYTYKSSPSTYNLIRNKFLPCLPSKEAVKKWNLPSDPLPVLPDLDKQELNQEEDQNEYDMQS